MPLLLVIVGIGIYEYLQQAKKFLDTYRIEFLDGKFDGRRTVEAGFKTIFFGIRIKVSNTTDFVGTLQSAKIALYWNRKKLGFVDLKNAVTIKANGITVVEIPVRMQTLNLIQSIPEMINLVSNNKSLVFHISGPLNFAAGTYNVDQDYRVPLLEA